MFGKASEKRSGDPRVLPAGDAAVTIEFGTVIDPKINDQVIAFSQAVDGLDLPGVIEVVPAYRSATVYFDPVTIDAAALVDRLRDLAASLPSPRQRTPRVLHIPVYYGGECGPDLPDVAVFAKLPPEDVIALHTSTTYRVYMLGFSPGFPYMGQVPQGIAIQRLATPRQKVPAGSVGIAGTQTGIYPLDSPGGWRLIGRTPVRLYDPKRTRPFLLEPQDRVRFVRIDRAEFDRLSRAVG